ncbi:MULTISPECIES: glycine zipper 2TM domain-containing protein [Sphingomonas]|uniref:glycine zipper 2TM domain-containing protein n=1 Tax=Sphingomonas TaxID=13687 RepID=UPI000DEFB6B3|nr:MULTISPECIES: glycine zipper 2TM domain-containing protein [Sphingomonas]
MRTMLMALSAASITLPAVMAAPAEARPHYYQDQSYNQNYYQGRTWYDDRGQARCRRSNGTTGLLIGAAGGALVGRAIDTHGHRATGTILGAAAGALLGRSIDRNRSGNRYYCR